MLLWRLHNACGSSQGDAGASSREVEEVIYQDSRVEEVAVIGVDRAKWVEAVTAVVVPRQGETITEDEIVTLCASIWQPSKPPEKLFSQKHCPKRPPVKF